VVDVGGQLIQFRVPGEDLGILSTYDISLLLSWSEVKRKLI
jgi:hypothetical protein